MSKFVIKREGSGFCFSLQATDGSVIFTSHVYTAKPSAINGIESLKKNLGVALEDQTQKGFTEEKSPKFVLCKEKGGKFSFSLLSTNGKTVIAIKGFKTADEAKNLLTTIKKTAKSASVSDESLIRKPAAAKTEKKAAGKAPAAKKNVAEKKAPAKKAAATKKTEQKKKTPATSKAKATKTATTKKSTSKK